MHQLRTTLSRALHQRLRGHDVPLIAAGLTFYGLVGGPPLMLLSTRLVAATFGAPWTRARLEQAAALLPDRGRAPVQFLASHGTTSPLLWSLAALIPIGLYGEGLVRAFGRLSPEDVRRRALRGRVVGASAVFIVPVALVLALVMVAQLQTSRVLLGTYLAFLVAWALASGALAAAYRWLPVSALASCCSCTWESTWAPPTEVSWTWR